MESNNTGAPQTTPGNPPTTEPTLTAPNGQTPPHGTPTTPNGKTPLETLPADVREYIEKLRTEAKTARLENETLTKAKQQEEAEKMRQQGEYKTLAEKFEAEAKMLQAEIAKRDAELAKRDYEALRTRVAARHGLAPELATRLVGQTEEELETDAQALKKLTAESTARPGNSPNPKGGAQTVEDRVHEQVQKMSRSGLYGTLRR